MTKPGSKLALDVPPAPKVKGKKATDLTRGGKSMQTAKGTKKSGGHRGGKKGY